MRKESAELVSYKDRFTVERFLGGIGDVVLKDVLLRSLSSGYQLTAAKVHEQALPAVVILACYSRYHEDIELVDDYDRLLDDYRAAIRTPGTTAHPDLFMASCIALLEPREQYPPMDSFEAIGVPAIFKQLINLEE